MKNKQILALYLLYLQTTVPFATGLRTLAVNFTGGLGSSYVCIYIAEVRLEK